jgi:hypothetical protein
MTELVLIAHKVRGEGLITDISTAQGEPEARNRIAHGRGRGRRFLP